jgi:hypothetical protein
MHQDRLANESPHVGLVHPFVTAGVAYTSVSPMKALWARQAPPGRAIRPQRGARASRRCWGAPAAARGTACVAANQGRER